MFRKIVIIVTSTWDLVDVEGTLLFSIFDPVKPLANSFVNFCFTILFSNPMTHLLWVWMGMADNDDSSRLDLCRWK